MNLFGEYNRYGYTISKQAGEVVYSATNHRQDSQQAAYTEQDRMTLREIRSACIRTGKEMAKERKGRFFGPERVADER